MRSRITRRGEVAIPKALRDALGFSPGTPIEFAVDECGGLVLRRAVSDRFEAVRGKADIPWRTDELMRLLRADD